MNSNNKVIFLTIIISAIVLKKVQTSTTNDFTVDQYDGMWYTLGITPLTHGFTHDMRCYRTNVTRIHGQSFLQNVNLIIDDIPVRIEGYGKIINDEIRVYYKHVNDTSAHKVSSYNHGEELILHDEIHPTSYRLMSRGISVLPETKAEFEKLVQKSNVKPVYISLNNCTQYN